jgi:glycosidase
MNYYFRENIINNLFKNNKLNLKNFINYYIENKYKYSNEINKGLFNLVSSHDVPRITQFFNGDLIKARIAFTLLLILPGTISFYYGDEIDLDYDKKNEFKRGAFN